MKHLHTIGALTLALAAFAHPAAAQDRPVAAVEFAGGALVFADDGAVTEGFVGGSGRFYVSPRISLGPEVSFIQGDNHNHLMLTGNVTIDLAAPGDKVTPFVVAGAGLFRSNESFPNNTTFSHNEGAFTAGGGVRALVGDYVIVGAEARVGWELHTRFNGFIGVRLGR
jgi:hypothetical protein